MRIIVDKDIPFIKGRLEKAGFETVYADQWGFTRGLVRDADALLIRTRTPVNEDLLGESKVKLVATATIGMDQIDLKWCGANGVTVKNAPGCNAPGVAQYVWSSLLRLGFNPKKQTLGIIGCGNVGSIVREWGERLGARLLISDPPRGMDYPLEKLLAESDAVTLHTPLTRDGKHPTFHLIGEKELAVMKTGSLLVNAARGPVVDFKALRMEISQGRIRAVIDTWEGEPDIDAEVLRYAEYGTPHIAGYSLEGKQRATRMVLESVEDFFGVEIDKSDLAGDYKMPKGLTAEKITASFNPAEETEILRREPQNFDRLRNNYNYRKEV